MEHSDEIPARMSAWTHTRRGAPSEVLSLAAVNTPLLNHIAAVKVQVSHCALNPGGSILMSILPFVFRRSPAIPEMDFAGTIVECTSWVEREDERGVKHGAQVFGSIPVSDHIKLGKGSLAEYVVVGHEYVVKKPEGIKMKEAAGLGVAGATALELIKAAKLKKGDSVLVNGASGGIGHLVTQMCREEVGETGKVVAVCSSGNVGWVKDLGCDEVIDYKLHSPVHEYLAEQFHGSRFNVMIDAIGIQDMFNNCPKFVVEGGPYVTVGPRAKSYSIFDVLATVVLMAKNALWPRIFGGVPRPYVQVTGTANPEALSELAQKVEAGKLKVEVGTVAKMENATAAYEQMLSGHARGKIVVQVSKDG